MNNISTNPPGCIKLTQPNESYGIYYKHQQLLFISRRFCTIQDLYTLHTMYIETLSTHKIKLADTQPIRNFCGDIRSK